LRDFTEAVAIHRPKGGKKPGKATFSLAIKNPFARVIFQKLMQHGLLQRRLERHRQHKAGLFNRGVVLRIRAKLLHANRKALARDRGNGMKPLPNPIAQRIRQAHANSLLPPQQAVHPQLNVIARSVATWQSSAEGA